MVEKSAWWTGLSKSAKARLNKYRKDGNSDNGLLHGKSIPAQVCAKAAANANVSHKQTGIQYAQQRLAKANSQKIKPSANNAVSFYSTSAAIEASIPHIRIELTEKPEKIVEPFGGQTNTLYKFAVFKTGERLNCLLTIVVESSEPTKGYFIIDGTEKNNLGASGLRQVFRLVKAKYPKLKQLYGTRITGAKKLSGKQDRSVVYDLTKI